MLFFLSVITARRETAFPLAGFFTVIRPLRTSAFFQVRPWSYDTYTDSDLRLRPLAGPWTVTGKVAFLPATTVLSRRVVTLKRTEEAGSWTASSPDGFFEWNVQVASILVEVDARPALRLTEVVSL